MSKLLTLQKPKALFLYTVGSLMCLVALTVLNPAQVAADYNGANIINNSTFLDSNSMSLSEVQQFLEDRGAGIANMEFYLDCYGSGSTERQWYTAAGATCDADAPASEIIYYAAQIYGLSPRVILATLQKEQSLVTTANPTEWQINQAMGYGCPTTGGCGASTFFYQVDSGTWVLRYHYERANGNFTWWNNNGYTCGNSSIFYSPGLIPGNSVTFTDENGVDYRTYTIANAATAALYCYTPHAYNNPQGLYGREPYGTVGLYYSGSYNFVYWFEIWFGSTQGTPLFKVPGDNKTYIEGASDTYYHVQSAQVRKAYGYGKRYNTIRVEDADYLNDKTYAGVLGWAADFEGSTTYLVDRGGKYQFQTSAMQEDVYGYQSSDVSSLLDSTADYLPTAGNMRDIIHEYDGDVKFLMENGKRRRFVDTDAYNSGSPAYSTKLYVRLSSDFMESLTPNTPILAPEKVIHTYNTGSYKYWNGANIYNIERDVAEMINLIADTGYELHSNEIAALPRFPETVSVRVRSTSTNFVLDVGQKRKVPTPELSAYGLTSGDFVQLPNELLSRIDTGQMSRIVTINGSGAKYLISGSERHHFDSAQAIAEQGLTYGEILDISAKTAEGFPDNGKRVYQTGTLFKITGQPQTYIINSSASKLYIDSNTIIDEYAFDRDTMRSLSSAAVADYSTAGTLGFITKDSSDNVWVVHSSGVSQPIPTSQTGSDRFDIDIPNTLKLSSAIHAGFSNTTSLRDILEDSSSGARYYMENGERRLLVSAGALTSLGYTEDDITLVSTFFLASITRGADI